MTKIHKFAYENLIRRDPMRNNAFLLLIALSIAVLTGCTTTTATKDATYPNPAAPGFNAAESDSQAIAIADQVMEAMGGRKAWDQTRFIRFTFFGRRHLIWDRHGKRARIEVPGDSLVYLYSYAQGDQATTYKNGEPVTEADSILKYTEQARRIWINDTYWLVMPYKLKDSGVTLKYLGEENIGQDGVVECDVLELTFASVGVTPQNKYHVWVDTQEHLVRQWAYFSSAEDSEPRITTLWLDYQPYGRILLSGNRGGDRALSDIDVPESLPDEVFTSY